MCEVPDRVEGLWSQNQDDRYNLNADNQEENKEVGLVEVFHRLVFTE